MKRIATNDQIDDRGAKRANAVGSPPASWEDMTQWMHRYDSVSESGQAISRIWSNTEANPSKTMKQVREIVCPMKSGAYDSEGPDDVRAAKYKSFVDAKLDELIGAMRVPDDLVAMMRVKLDDLVAVGEYGAAMALLAYPHGTVDGFAERHGVVPEVVKLPSPTGETRLFIWFGDSEKDKMLYRDGRRFKPRLIPVVPDVCEDAEMLQKICERSRGRIGRGLLVLRPWMASLGMPSDVRSARRLGATVLLQWLARDARDLLLAAPLSHLSWLNVALGHRPRSNQWTTYLLGFHMHAASDAPMARVDHDRFAEFYQRLFDATDGLATNAGYLEASYTSDPPTFWWDYYDHDVEERWLDDGGTVEARPSTNAPPELVMRLRAVTAEHGVPCDLRAGVPHAPVDIGFGAAYAKWLRNEGPWVA
jgi:hypothetical protein